MLTRVDTLEAQNTYIKQESKRLAHVNQQDIKRLTEENDRLSHANDVLTGRLSHINDVLNQRLTSQNDDHQPEVERLSHANKELNERLFHVHVTLEQRVERLEVVSSRQTATNQSPEPDTRSQFTAFACTLGSMAISCPSNRTILVTSGVYGVFDSPNSECTDCCAPNPQYDCTELVEEARPSDWLAIQALCDGQTSCEFENPGTVLDDCSDEASDYMQLYYDCLLDDETGPVAFTAWANTGGTTLYNTGDIIVFNELLTHAGGHFNTATSSFICPWDGIYLVSVTILSGQNDAMRVQLMRNDVMLTDIQVDAIDGHNHGSTTVVTECDRSDTLWMRAGRVGTLWADDRRNLFTAHILHRF